MKAVTSNLIDTLQGRHQNWIAKPGSYTPIQGLETRVSISQFRSSVRREAWQINARTAFKIIQTKYTALKANLTVFQTWQDEASALSVSHGYRINSWMLFSAYYITKYYNAVSVSIRVSDLPNADTTFYADKENVNWV